MTLRGEGFRGSFFFHRTKPVTDLEMLICGGKILYDRYL